MEIKDKVFILTGAARIGVDVAKELTARGAKFDPRHILPPNQTSAI
ncbi:MAG: hypothetical protein WDN47_00780 [Candidatus Doudnabacteria bacterium]